MRVLEREGRRLVVWSSRRRSDANAEQAADSHKVHDSEAMRVDRTGSVGPAGVSPHQLPRQRSGDPDGERGTVGETRSPAPPIAPCRIEGRNSRSLRDLTRCEQPALAHAGERTRHSRSGSTVPAGSGPHDLAGDNLVIPDTTGANSWSVDAAARASRGMSHDGRAGAQGRSMRRGGERLPTGTRHRDVLLIDSRRTSERFRNWKKERLRLWCQSRRAGIGVEPESVSSRNSARR
jgi:hypothetical protein